MDQHIGAHRRPARPFNVAEAINKLMFGFSKFIFNSPVSGGVMAGRDATRISGKSIVGFNDDGDCNCCTVVAEPVMFTVVVDVGDVTEARALFDPMRFMLLLLVSSAWSPSKVELYVLNSVYRFDLMFKFVLLLLLLLLVADNLLFCGSSEVGELKSSDSRDLKWHNQREG
jgi:hypothetical protein